MKKQYLLFWLWLLAPAALAQSLKVERINPASWFVGMKNPRVQLLLHGQHLGGCRVRVNYPGVRVESVTSTENPNYLFVDLLIGPEAKPGTLQLEISRTLPITETRRGQPIITGGREVTLRQPFELLPRTARPQKISQADFIYLLLPDRFANGDPANDAFPGMADIRADRQNPFLRHGGDLQGVLGHLDYFGELGVTTLWLNPVVENDQPLTDEGGSMRSAYHGYGFTDHYQVDRRLGGNTAFKKLVDAAHGRGLKVMYDVVFNHVGANHFTVKDPPTPDWLHTWPAYTNTSHKEAPIIDPYAAEHDKRLLSDGWFVPFLPDLNQQNPLVARFLIQYALWTIEYFGIDAYRVDTYRYNDLELMNRLNQAIFDEHPDFYITGENWVATPVSQAYYVRNRLQVPFKSNLPSAIDFTLQSALLEGINQKFGWAEGINRPYNVLSQDLLYEDPRQNLTFLDNHDTDRFFSVVGENFDNYKLGLTLLMTLRGVPSIYYGTEFLMKNFKNPSDAEVRQDFPGGFPGDKVNKFLREGRTARENEAFALIGRLARLRKTPALAEGQLTQFTPVEGIYTFFRHTPAQSVMVVCNTGTEARSVSTAPYAERLKGFTAATDVLTGQPLPGLGTLQVPARTALVLELK